MTPAGRGRALLEYGRLLDVLAVEGELLAETTRGRPPGRPVPNCPGLTLGETARHVGSTYRMVLSWLRDGRQPGQWQQDPGAGEDTADYLLAGLRELLDELAAHRPEESCPTWWPRDTSYGFWRRRMAHETTVHRIDAQDAAGVAPDPIADDVAIDGVDEVLTLWFTHRLSVLGVAGTRNGLVAVRTGGEAWLARAGPAGSAAWRAVPEELGQAQATVSGEPRDVYLWLWGRLPTRPEIVRIDGDADAVAQLWALLRLGTK
ncbi:maleylpyruvate isomerase family mycothiol-dependent enzyme [Solihabitans fulvus]|uniref:Maleylpyruvate isomerase family mycothiol-dependent enzyme n=1 Tax=Solihabitans fulvus TaxID=1892852 RepID=A0A5B2WY64_9PSEU|nr:maleylpyruvate isomerase family mycothiol-dependent enzyme [Solihabitans fulvus]KAA2256521.1 maleylpyruvate isomerase family mycothiol-dependent enzyme [Solihabitans fulvus]